MPKLCEPESDVLLYVMDNEWANLRTIQSNTELGEASIRTSISKLQDLKCIMERKGAYNSREIALTELGKKVGFHLKQIDELLN